LIAREYHPFSLVEDAEFRRFVPMLCPGYQIPSRKTLTNNLIPILHQTTVRKVKATLDVATADCLTADGWTSVNNNSFLAITAHFLDEETNMCSKLVGCVEFNEKHTAANLADMLHEVQQDNGRLIIKLLVLLQTMLLILFLLSISVNGVIYLAMLTLLI
jgi:hypothetical protein